VLQNPFNVISGRCHEVHMCGNALANNNNDNENNDSCYSGLRKQIY